MPCRGGGQFSGTSTHLRSPALQTAPWALVNQASGAVESSAPWPLTGETGTQHTPPLRRQEEDQVSTRPEGPCEKVTCSIPPLECGREQGSDHCLCLKLLLIKSAMITTLISAKKKKVLKPKTTIFFQHKLIIFFKQSLSHDHMLNIY